MASAIHNRQTYALLTDQILKRRVTLRYPTLLHHAGLVSSAVSSSARTPADVRCTLCSEGLPGVGETCGFLRNKGRKLPQSPQTKYQLARFLIRRIQRFRPHQPSEVFGPRHRTTADQAHEPSARSLTISNRTVPVVRAFEWVFQYPGSVYYSKAGSTSDTRTTPRTSACRTAPNTSSLFSPSITASRNSKQTEIIPFVSQPIAQAFAKTAPKADLEPVDA